MFGLLVEYRFRPTVVAVTASIFTGKLLDEGTTYVRSGSDKDDNDDCKFHSRAR